MSIEEKHYYIADPDAVKGVLEHQVNYAKISEKREGSEEWRSVGYISWSKAGKTLTVMIADKTKRE
jgi:ribosomal protein L14E/L6E/L27E